MGFGSQLGVKYILYLMLGAAVGESHHHQEGTHCGPNLSPFLAKHGRGMADLTEQVKEAAHFAMGPVLQQLKVAEDNQNHGRWSSMAAETSTTIQ